MNTDQLYNRIVRGRNIVSDIDRILASIKTCKDLGYSDADTIKYCRLLERAGTSFSLEQAQRKRYNIQLKYCLANQYYFS